MTGRLLRGTGETFITLGIVILLFCGYELWFTGLETAREQGRLKSELTELWEHGGGRLGIDEIPLGDGVAILRIPRFGTDYAKVIVEGVSVADLKKGPGHYPKTQLPGEIGNFVVSGHRTTYGAPFGRVDELRPNDPIVVETADMWFTYQVTLTEIVRPTAVDVALPVPHQKSEKPTKAIMTFTSCNPKYSARERIIVYSELAHQQKKTEGLPPALAA